MGDDRELTRELTRVRRQRYLLVVVVLVPLAGFWIAYLAAR